MECPKTASREEWVTARKALVEELTRLRDQFSAGGANGLGSASK
jgi:hypothetical protein